MELRNQWKVYAVPQCLPYASVLSFPYSEASVSIATMWYIVAARGLPEGVPHAQGAAEPEPEPAGSGADAVAELERRLADMAAQDLYYPSRRDGHVPETKATKDTILIAHNIWCYLYGLQRANAEFDTGKRPAPLTNVPFEDLIDCVISTADTDCSLQTIKHYERQLGVA